MGQSLRVGAASVDITPPVGTPMAGYYAERLSKGVHDPLYAKAIVLERGGKKAALVSLDLISTPMAMVEEARREIEKTTGIDGRRRDDLRHPRPHRPGPPGPRGRGRSPSAATTPWPSPISEGLPAKIAEGVRLADKALRPAKVAAGHGQESSISFNRRFHMTDGTVGWNPGKHNPKILKPAGTIDPDVAVVYFEADDKDRTPLATYVNHAVHLDNVGGMEFSADMPATVADLLGRFKGPGMVTLYTSGCCGDINHIDVRWAEPQRGHENAARMGVILAAEVLRTWPRLKAEPPGALRVKSARVKLPLAKITPEDVETSRAAIARLDGKGKPPAFLEQVRAFKVLDVEARQGEPIEVEVQVIALGDRIAWVSLPGEIFVELGLAIKQDSPFPHTIIAELANGAIGYIPSRRAYAQGNYEVVERPVRRGVGRDAGGRGGEAAQGTAPGSDEQAGRITTSRSSDRWTRGGSSGRMAGHDEQLRDLDDRRRPLRVRGGRGRGRASPRADRRSGRGQGGRADGGRPLGRRRVPPPRLPRPRRPDPVGREARAFLADRPRTSREKLIDRLLAGPDYPRRMQELFHVMLMERLGDHPAWTNTSASPSRPTSRGTARPRDPPRRPEDEATRGAAFFFAKRLENYGENPVDYPALTGDVGRLFLGMDLRCAQCHDHLFIDDYKQHDFQGLLAFFQNAALQDVKGPVVGEKPTTQKIAFMSVFKKSEATGPRLPGGEESRSPLKKGEEYLRPPDRRRAARRAALQPAGRAGRAAPGAREPRLRRNIVNRLWFAMMGRGLVHPLDLHHADNPPRTPNCSTCWPTSSSPTIRRQVAAARAGPDRTYQRSSLLPEDGRTAARRASSRPLRSGSRPSSCCGACWRRRARRDRPRRQGGGAGPRSRRARFVKAFANPPREPEDEFSPR